MKKILQVMIVAIIALNLIATPNSLKAGNPQGVVMTKFFNSTQMNSPSVINSFDKVFDMGSNLSGKMIVSIDNKPMLAVYKLNSGKCDWHKWNGTQWVYQYSLGNIVPGFEEPRTLNTYKYATWDEYTMHVVDTGNGDVVTPTNTLAVALAGPTSGKINTTYTYTATITGGTIPYTLAWSADGFVSQSGTSTNYKWATSGTKKVEVYVTDNLGQTASANLPVTISSPLSVSISGPTSGKVDTSYTFTSTVSGGGTTPYSYSWSGGGTPATGTSSTFTTQWSTAGTKTIALTVTDSLGQTGSANLNVTIIDNYTLTVNINPPGAGSVTPSGGSYTSGTVVTLTETPIASYKFVNWSGDATGSGSSVTVTMNSNKTVTANFAINYYTVTASAGTGGSISPSGAITVNYGSSKSFTITANAGYKISSVTVDGSSVGAVSSYTFSNVTSNHTINASFTIIPLSVSISGPTEGKLNTSYTYTSSVSGGLPPYTYGSWLVFDGSWSAAGSGTSCSHSWSNSGTGAVYLAITDALGQTAYAFQYVTISPPLSVSISGTTNGDINTSYTYTSSVSGGTAPYTYSWSGGGTPSTGSSSSFTTQWSTVSFRTVSVTVTDALGQTGSASLTVTICKIVTHRGPCIEWELYDCYDVWGDVCYFDSSDDYVCQYIIIKEVCLKRCIEYEYDEVETCP